MKHYTLEHPYFGRCLYATNDVVEIIIPLDYGIRIGHFSFCGGQNVFYQQPHDMTELTTPAGWRVRGGHRIWLAPESEKVYCPDNEPIQFEILDNGVLLTQQEDPWLRIKKSMRIIFSGGAELEVTNRIENTGEEPLSGAIWAISVMAPGGTEEISFALREGGMDHWRRISMWDHTSLGDPRAEYRRDGIRLRHSPIDLRYKIGIGHPLSPVRYENNGVTFIKAFPVMEDLEYPDGNVSFETFMCKHMLEIESLSPLMTIPAGQTREHTELWRLCKSENEGGTFA